MIPVLSPEQAAAWDATAVADGIALATLMEAAGRAATAVLAARYAHRLRDGVLIAAGPGHNGGDGWVVARALHRLDIPVWVTAPAGPAAELREAMAGRARAEGVREVAPDGPWPSIGLVVDALLGTGARGAPRATMGILVERMYDLEVPVIAIDGPTGVDLATGIVHGAPHAALSITFGGVRRGHLLARDEVGAIAVVDIGHPPPDAAWPSLVTDTLATGWLRRLKGRDHKGDRGRVVIVGGDVGMSGAARMAARAAFGAGAGLVHVAAPAETVAALTAAEPDVQTLVHPLDGVPDAALLALVDRADAVVIGPGLGRGAGRRDLVAALLRAAKAAVLDADGLIAFQGAAESLHDLAAGRQLVMTPHPGEFRALFPALAPMRELDPWAAAAAAAEQSGATVLLKGVPTVVASSGRPPFTVAAGNPGLATGGSGDVLSGLVGVGLAQRLDAPTAAAFGAQALGRAADIAARRIAARSVRPMDVVGALPDLWREWELQRLTPPLSRPPILLELDAPQLV